ncbi:hypothetical protein [Streptococcus sp. NLN64]|nr:hypothetical protein [Streptococcus sp. NLN64]
MITEENKDFTFEMKQEQETIDLSDMKIIVSATQMGNSWQTWN